MEDTIEYWENCLNEFESSLDNERIIENNDDYLYTLLKRNIKYCNKKIKEFE